MATFGDTTEYTSWNYNYANSNQAYGPYTLLVASLTSKLTVYCRNNGAGHGACNVMGLIYAVSSGAPGALVAATPAIAMADNLTSAARDLTFTSAVSLSAASYFLGIIGDADSDGFGIAYADPGTGSVVVRGDTYVGGPADPYGTPDATIPNLGVSIYATYTVPVAGAYMTTRRGMW